MNKLLGTIFGAFMVSVMLTGCMKDDNTKDDNEYPEYIVFGFYQSNGCVGEACIEVFKMESGQLIEDDLDVTPESNNFYPGHYTHKLNPTKYETIQSIFKDKIPDELLNEPSGSLGTPNGWTTNYYFEYKSSTVHKHWVMDGTLQTVPSQYVTFVNTVSNAAFSASAN